MKSNNSNQVQYILNPDCHQFHQEKLPRTKP